MVQVGAQEGSVHMDDEDFSSESDMNANDVPHLASFSGPHNMQGDTQRTKGQKKEEENPFEVAKKS